MLTPDKIAAFNQATGNSVPLDAKPGVAPVQSRAAQIRALAQTASKEQGLDQQNQGYDTSAGNAFGVGDMLTDVGKGALKGAGSTLATGVRGAATITSGIMGVAAKKDASGIGISKQNDVLISQIQKLPQGDPQRAQLEAKVRSNIDKLISGGSEGAGATVSKVGQGLLDVGSSNEALGSALGNKDLLKPTNTAQKIGFGVEQAAEYAIPAAKVAKAEKLLDTAVAASDMGKFASAATRVAGKAALEGTAAGGVALAQTGDLKKAAEVGGTTAAVSGVIRSIGEAARALGIPQYLYSRIFKNSYQDMRAGMNTEGLQTLQKTNPEKFAKYVESGIIKVGEDGKPIVNETLAQEALNRGLSGSLKTMANTTVENLADSEHDVRALASGFKETVSVPAKPLSRVLTDIATNYEGVGDGTLSEKALDLASKVETSGGALSGDDTLAARRLFDRLRIQSSYNTPAPKLSLGQENFKYWSDALRNSLNKIPGMKDAMSEYAFNIDAMTELAKAAARQGNKEALGLIDSVFAGESFAGHSPVPALLGVARRVVQAPGVATKVAQGIAAPAVTTAVGSAIKGGAARGVVEAVNP